MVLREHGAPDVLHLEELPEPALRDTDVLVEVHASSVNPVDTKVRGARERAARISADARVRRQRHRGALRSACHAMAGRRRDLRRAQPVPRRGERRAGRASTARSAARKPASLEHAIAASLPLVSQTAWEALHLRARIQPGQTVLIHAGAGGVGHIAVQLAKLHGCRVITTAGREESLAFCRDALRADDVIDYRNEDVVGAREGADRRARRPGGVRHGRRRRASCNAWIASAVNGHVVTILGGSTDLRQRGQSPAVSQRDDQLRIHGHSHRARDRARQARGRSSPPSRGWWMPERCAPRCGIASRWNDWPTRIGRWKPATPSARSRSSSALSTA